MLLNAVFYALILLFVIMLLSLWYKHCYVRLPRRLVVIRKVLIIEKIINKQIEVMIHTVPNPKMTTREVDKFREDFRKCVSGKLTLKESRAINIRTQRMSVVAKRIIANNGCKNPILGY